MNRFPLLEELDRIHRTHVSGPDAQTARNIVLLLQLRIERILDLGSGVRELDDALEELATFGNGYADAIREQRRLDDLDERVIDLAKHRNEHPDGLCPPTPIPAPPDEDTDP